MLDLLQFRPWHTPRAPAEPLPLQNSEGAYPGVARTPPRTPEPAFPLTFEPSEPGVFPRLVHHLWIGPRPIPARHRAYRDAWLQALPDWHFVLWDDERLSRLELPGLSSAAGLDLDEDLCDCENVGERSDILRYALLARFGGVYLDLDVCPMPQLAPPVPQASAEATGAEATGAEATGAEATGAEATGGPWRDFAARWEQVLGPCFETGAAFVTCLPSSQEWRLQRMGAQAAALPAAENAILGGAAASPFWAFVLAQARRNARGRYNPQDDLTGWRSEGYDELLRTVRKTGPYLLAHCLGQWHAQEHALPVALLGVDLFPHMTLLDLSRVPVPDTALAAHFSECLWLQNSRLPAWHPGNR